jgi:hypothetical protein
MGFLKKLSQLLSSPGGSAPDPYGIHFYVKCDHCGDVVHVRADRRNDLTRTYEGEGTFLWKKEIIDGRCFRLMQAEVVFDARYNPLSQEINGGHFVTEEEFRQKKPAQAS